MLNPKIDICSNIILLRNGFFSAHGKSTVQTTNTCSFDSFYVIVTAMYADYVQVKNQINKLVNHCKFSKMVSHMFTSGSSLTVKQTALLRQRNILLLDIFKDAKDAIQFMENGLVDIDCATNAHYIIEKALPINLYSYSRKKQCNLCNRILTSNRCFFDINFEEYDRLGIENLNHCLLESLVTETTGTCTSKTCAGSVMVIHTEFSNFVAIDLQLKQEIKMIALDEIPKTLNVLEVQFTLTGCIEFIGDVDELMTANRNGIRKCGHYVSV